jgi:predicted secreted protein
MRWWRGLVLGCVTVAAVLVVTRGVIVRESEMAEHHSTTSGVTVVTDKSVGKVSLKVGGVLEVRLRTNGGNVWIVPSVANPILVRDGQVMYELHPAGSEAGVGDVEIDRFKTVKAGKQDLQFEFCGPWEKGASAAKKVVFSVEVQ